MHGVLGRMIEGIEDLTDFGVFYAVLAFVFKGFGQKLRVAHCGRRDRSMHVGELKFFPRGWWVLYPL